MSQAEDSETMKSWTEFRIFWNARNPLNPHPVKPPEWFILSSQAPTGTFFSVLRSMLISTSIVSTPENPPKRPKRPGSPVQAIRANKTPRSSEDTPSTESNTSRSQARISEEEEDNRDAVWFATVKDDILDFECETEIARIRPQSTPAPVDNKKTKKLSLSKRMGINGRSDSIRRRKLPFPFPLLVLYLLKFYFLGKILSNECYEHLGAMNQRISSYKLPALRGAMANCWIWIQSNEPEWNWSKPLLLEVLRQICTDNVKNANKSVNAELKSQGVTI